MGIKGIVNNLLSYLEVVYKGKVKAGVSGSHLPSVIRRNGLGDVIMQV